MQLLNISSFTEAVGETAAHLLVQLFAYTTTVICLTLAAADKSATSVRDLNCRRVGGWAVFYAAQMVANRCQITIVLVGRLDRGSFAALESEAEKRQRRL